MKNHNPERRDFLRKSATGTLAIGLGVTAIGSLVAACNSPEGNKTGSADTSNTHNAEMAPAVAGETSEREMKYRMDIVPIVHLSKKISELAASKATDKYVKEFGGFELEEATGLASVLKDMGTPDPEMDAKAKDTIAKLEKAMGTEFDKEYIKAETEGHMKLKDMAEAYIKESNSSNMAEKHTRHIASIVLVAHKEHIAICNRIMKDVFKGMA